MFIKTWCRIVKFILPTTRKIIINFFRYDVQNANQFIFNLWHTQPKGDLIHRAHFQHSSDHSCQRTVRVSSSKKFIIFTVFEVLTRKEVKGIGNLCIKIGEEQHFKDSFRTDFQYIACLSRRLERIPWWFLVNEVFINSGTFCGRNV